MCKSSMYVGHSIPLEWALLMLEDALEGNAGATHESNFTLICRTRSHETLGQFEEANECYKEINKRKYAIIDKVIAGDL